MPIIDPALGIRLIYIFGIVNIIALLLVLFSCRCLAGGRFAKKMQKYKWYGRFYNFHCYYWWIFIASVAIHSSLAILVFGNII